MKVIVFPNQKGGVGKTSVAASVAVQKATGGFKTCLVDCDDQANSSSWILGDMPLKAELADVLLKRSELSDALVQTKIENLFMLPTIGLGGSLRLYSKTRANESPFAMRQLMRKLEAENFDYAFFDVPPNFLSVVEMCMLASDEAIVVTELNEFSHDGLAELFDNIKDMQERFDTNRPKMDKIIITKRDHRLKIQEAMLKTLSDAIPENFTIFVIPTDQAFPKSQDLKVPVQVLAETKAETLRVLKEISDAI